MFGFLKRTKIEAWEIETIKSILHKLSPEYNKYINQTGLLNGVLIGMGDIPNYIQFSYNPKVYELYEKQKEENYKISNIKIKEIYTKDFINISLYFAYGIINGYSVDTNISKYEFTIDEIDIRNIKKIIIGGNDFEKIKILLNKNEQKLINKTDVYKTIVNGHEYYHIKKIEDGDFIGMDLENNLYKIEHETNKIEKIDRSKLMEYGAYCT